MFFGYENEVHMRAHNWKEVADHLVKIAVRTPEKFADGGTYTKCRAESGGHIFAWAEDERPNDPH